MKPFQFQLTEDQSRILGDLAAAIESDLGELEKLQEADRVRGARAHSLNENIAAIRGQIDAGDTADVSRLVSDERELQLVEGALRESETAANATRKHLVEITAEAKDTLQSQLGPVASHFRDWAAECISRLFPEPGAALRVVGEAQPVRAFRNWLAGYWWSETNPEAAAKQILRNLRPILRGEFPFLKD